jgi:hypothetical protein
VGPRERGSAAAWGIPSQLWDGDEELMARIRVSKTESPYTPSWDCQEEPRRQGEAA